MIIQCMIALLKYSDLLNSPWGIAQASFFKNDPSQGALLIGNFGDGRINAYSQEGKFLGQLRSKGKPLAIDGFWAITFAPSRSEA